MDRALRDLPFEDWVAHVFDHEVGGPQWYFDLDSPYWAGPSDITLHYIARLFNDPLAYLQPYSDAQLNQGFWYLVSAGDLFQPFLDPLAPLQLRIDTIGSVTTLFDRLFRTRCSPHLSHLDEPGANPLNLVCYMWWDIAPFGPGHAPGDPHAFDDVVLGVMESQVGMDSIACQESGLHGLGNWMGAYPDRIRRTLDRFLLRRDALRPDVLRYAEAARSGCVL